MQNKIINLIKRKFGFSNVLTQRLYGWILKLKQLRGGISSDYFVSPEHTYLASADNYKGLESLIELNSLFPCKHFYSVIGGMGGLNVLSRLENVKTITWFDINPHMIDICRLMLKIITSSSTREDFISLVFCKPFSQKNFPSENIISFYKQPISSELRRRLSQILTVDELQIYNRFYLPYSDSVQQEFVLGPCLHCTSLRIYHEAPVDGIMTHPFISRDYIQQHKIQNINSFFYGMGWLRDENRFENVKRLLKQANVSVERKTIFELTPLDASGLYSSNVLDGYEVGFSNLINKFDWTIWYSNRTKYLNAEYVFGDRYIIPCEKVYSGGKRNPHQDCCILLEETVNILEKRFLEIIQPNGMEGMNSGFRFFVGQKKIHIQNYLAEAAHDQDVSLIVLHMLMGNGCDFDVWKQVVEKSIRTNLTLCVFEHNPTAREWPEAEVCHWNIPPIVMIDRFLLSVSHGWKKYGTLSLKGNGVRNYCWVLHQ